MNELLSEPDSHIRDKVKVVFRLVILCYEDQLKDATGVDTSNLAAKTDFIVLKAEVYKLHINNSVNAQTSLNNLKTKVGDFRSWKVENCSYRFEKIN